MHNFILDLNQRSIRLSENGIRYIFTCQKIKNAKVYMDDENLKNGHILFETLSGIWYSVKFICLCGTITFFEEIRVK